MDLSSQQLETLAKRLDERREEVLANVVEHVARTRQDGVPGVVGAVGDEADLAFAETLQDTDTATLRLDVRELRNIEEARARMESGGYGTCVSCGEPIGYARLVAQPAAVRCLRCQDLYEHTHVPPDAAAAP